MVKSELTYETLKFEEDNDNIKVVLLRYFYFEFPISEFDFDVKVKDGNLYAETSQSKLDNKFSKILTNGLNNLKSSLTGKAVVYIHRNMGLPLIGHNAFGIIDRNTNLIEIKPITGCNLNCVFCSVDEGKDSRKVADYVVEKDYMIEELKKVIQYKDCDDIEINIGTNGEPLLYADTIPLIKDLNEIKQIKRISINTNGTLLTEKTIDELKQAGLTQINLSLNALDKELAAKLCGAAYNLDHILKIAKYAAKTMDIIIAPVWVPGLNDSEMPKLIEFGKKIGAKYVAIQNFLNYKLGRNPAKQKSWDKFYEELKEFENKYKMKLIFDAKDFKINSTKKLQVPFKKGEILKLRLLYLGRQKNEKLATARGRIISVITNSNIGKEIKAEIVRTKHNIIVAKEI